MRTEHDVESALVELRERRPRIRRAVVKLNDSFSGEGNAVVRYPRTSPTVTRGACASIELPLPTVQNEVYFDEARAHGRHRRGVHRSAPEKASPSAQLRISPAGEVVPISTHDQILGGPSGQAFLGCSFPAHDDYRHAISEVAHRIGGVLASTTAW